MNAGPALTFLLLCLSLAWKVPRLWRAPRDRALWAITACTACVAGSLALGRPQATHAVDALLGAGSARLLVNAFLLAAAYSLLCFYLYSTADRRRAARRARIEAVPLVLALAVVTATTVTMPQGDRVRAFSTADMTVAQVALFSIAADLYLVYALVAAARWTVRFARLCGPPVSTGLWLAAAALIGRLAASGIGVVDDVTGWYGGRLPTGLQQCETLLGAMTFPLFTVGMNYSSAAARLTAVRVWHQHRRTYRKLGPLWTALYTSFPEVVLSRAPNSVRPMALRGRGVHRRYYRRVIECRDGLVRISPHLARLGVQCGTPPTAVAGSLRRALRAHADGEPACAAPFAVAPPQEDSLEADVQALVSVSEALGAST